MQVAVDDDIDALGIDARGGDRLRQRVGRGGQFHALAGAAVQLVAAAGVEQDGVLARLDDIAVEAQRQAVRLIRRQMAAPQRLGTTPNITPASHQ